MISQKERWRRWQLAIGVEDEQNELSDHDRRLNAALSALYDSGTEKRRGGLGASSPRVAKWLGDIREFFPTPVVQIVQKDAFERLNLKALMLEPEFLSTLEADVHLVADLIALRAAIPTKTLETARQVVRKVVDDLIRRLEHNTRETLRGARVRAGLVMPTLTGRGLSVQTCVITNRNTAPWSQRRLWDTHATRRPARSSIMSFCASTSLDRWRPRLCIHRSSRP